MRQRIVVAPELEAMVAGFGDYQRVERRLAPLSIHQDSYEVRAFLAWRAGSGAGDLGDLTADELIDFVVAQSARLQPRSVQSVVGALRGFVRFLYATGAIDADLCGAVPSVAAMRYTGAIRAVDTETVSTMLDSCDRTTRLGRRNYAILVLMVRLGLRAVEVSRMRLDDIDWRAGEMVVHGKGGRSDRLPIPVDVGEALADYLRHGRPQTSCREVFVQAIGPAVGMSRNAVVLVSRAVSVRAGLDVVASHRLRHTAATAMLARGATMREVGQVLRHDDSSVTAIYAKVDQSALSLLVRPWPGAGQ